MINVNEKNAFIENTSLILKAGLEIIIISNRFYKLKNKERKN